MSSHGELIFKHFKHPTEVGLCTMIQSWVNGETDDISFVAEFNIIEGSDGKWHAFVKAIRERTYD